MAANNSVVPLGPVGAAGKRLLIIPGLPNSRDEQGKSASNNVQLMADRRSAGESSELGRQKDLPTQKGSRNGPEHRNETSDHADPEQDLAWNDAPGLPLIFGDESQKPIEISSDSGSDNDLSTSSRLQEIVEESLPESDTQHQSSLVASVHNDIAHPAV